jgi:exonuclease SbcC
VADARDALESVRKEGFSASEAVVRARTALEQAERAAEDARLAHQDASRRAAGLSNSLAYVVRALDGLEADDDRISDERNPFAEEMARDAGELRALEDRIRAAAAELRDAESTRELASGWSSWFKEIRLGLIGEALSQLEAEVNGRASELGLVGWELLFDVDRETKGGTVQRGFSVSVLSPDNARPVPWEAWSGGESQRLRLAAQQGLGDLVRARTGCPLELEFWDEPTQWMGKGGIDDLMDGLARRAADRGRQIWVIDHRSLGYGGFAGTLRVVKTAEGSKFDDSGLP